jgi:hypothetical protein
VSILRNPIYIVGLSVFLGIFFFFINFCHVQKGSGHLREDDYYLIYRENIVSVFCIVIRVFLLKRRVVRLVSILSR